VATYSTGITVTWDGTDFDEVQELSWSYGGGRQGRDTEWTGDQGSVTVTCLGGTNTNISNYGLRRLFEIAGGGAPFSTYAMWESVNVSYERNGVTRFAVTLKILDD
jgi:hypothetical protein